MGNTLATGPGVLAGVVRDVVNAGAGVPDAAVIVVSAGDPARRAVVVSGADGRWQVADVALGSYFVQAERAGWFGGTAPVEVLVFSTAPSLLSINFALTRP